MSDQDLLTQLRRLDGPVEPSSAFRADLLELLERERGSPTLSADQTPTPLPRPPASSGRPIGIALATFAAVLLFGLGTFWLFSGREDPAATSTPTTIDDSVTTTVPAQGDTEREIRLPADRHPIDASYAGDRLWVLAGPAPEQVGQRPSPEAYLMGLDPASGVVEVEVLLTDAPNRVAAGGNAVWVTHWESGAVSRLSPETGQILATVPLRLPFDFGGDREGSLFVPFDVVIGHDSLWVSTARGAVARIGLESSDLLGIHEFPGRSLGAELAVGPGGVWVTGDVAGIYHLSSESGTITRIALEALDHSASSVFVAGGENGDTVYVSGDRLERNDEGGFRVIDGAYRAAGETGVSRVDPETFEVLGSMEIERPTVHLGWVNGFVGVLDDRGVFTHLSSIPRLGSQANHTTWTGGRIIHFDRQAWEIDSTAGRLIRVDETEAAAVDLPFEIDENVDRRPITGDLGLSADWNVLDRGPLSSGSASAIWTGEELVVWGGSALGQGSARRSGAAYRPDTGEWRSLGDSPVPNPSEAIWTGEELIVWSGIGTAWAWASDTNEWRAIADWPLGTSHYPLAVWTGEEIVDIGSGLAVDPLTGDSRSIASPPDLHERASAVSVDRYVVSVTGEGMYDVAADEWIDVPESPLTPLATAGVAVDGRVFAVDYDMGAAMFDPFDREWLDLPFVPLRFYECAPGVHVLRGAPVVDHCAGLVFWDQADSAWIPVPHPDPLSPSSIFAAGDRFFAWGEEFFEFIGDPVEPSRLAVGTGIFDVPDGWSVTSISGMAGGESMQVAVASGNESCVITATHLGAAGVLQSFMTDATTATRVSPHVGGDPVDALAVPAGAIDDLHHLVWATGTTDVVDLACSSRSAAEQLAPLVWSPFQ